MKVLYLDLLSPVGHKNLNKILVRLLKELVFVDVSWKEGYIEDESLLSAVGSFYPIPEIYYKFNSKVDYRIKNYNKIKWILKNININSYDLIFISSYETISFALAWPRKIKPRAVILNHNNLDELKDPLKKFLFKRIPKYVEHIVFEEYMKRYLLKDVKIPNKVWTIHHPINLDEVQDYQRLLNSKISNTNAVNSKLIFAPSNSNDENFISQLINLQKEEGFLNSTIFNLLIKSKQYEYQDNHLIVSRRYFSYEEYLTYLGNASLVLLPYCNAFRYRVSGFLFDTFAFKKKIIASSIPLFRYFVNKYPSIGKIFNNIQEFKEIVYFYNEQIKNVCSQDDMLFEKIQNTYSIKSIKEEVQRMLGGGQ